MTTGGKALTLNIAQVPQPAQQMTTFQTAEVAGIVTQVAFAQRRGDPTTFKIHCPNMKRTFDAVCDLFCPIRVGDTIYALCMIGPDMRLHVSRPPFVQPAIDRDSIVQCFMRALKQGYGPAIKIYSNMSRIAGGDDAVIPFLTGIAQSWNDTHNADILFMFAGTEPDDVKKLLSWWHKERNLRRLYLFGLTKKEINACRMTCDEIYLKCMENPYTIPAIPLDKCDAILERLNKRPETNNRARGAIVRMLWGNLHERSWTGTPTRFLARQFPGIKDHVEALKAEYGMVAEFETAYLKFPHQVETFITDFVVGMVRQDRITYDTPLDQVITLEDGTVIQRYSAHFTRELSEDQQKAVQGALDHNLCIITGAAGTGKTTVLGQIIHNLELRGIPYAVCSFTGKAVARIREVTKKRNPATMHRLIANTKVNQLDRRNTQYEKEIPMGDYEHILVDETSMVTEELLYDFRRAYPNAKRFTFVGDVNQLPPIGWGSLFKELLKSSTIPTYYLTTNYRVYTTDGERDGIILNANAIISHDPMYPFEFVPTDNFNIIEGPIDRVYDIIRGCYAGGVRAEQLVIITPYNRPLDILNRTFQDIYNTGARSVTDTRGMRWMINDRVMLLDNDKEIGVMNGETGIIRDITDQAILVDFGQAGCHEFLLEPTHQRANFEYGTAVPYHRRGQQMDEVMDGDEGEFEDERTVKRLKLAYALTIDKFQGSESDFVIGYIDEFNTGSFLNKNRIYTMITRAKRALWMVVSSVDALNEVAVKAPPFRCDNLARRLTAALPNLRPFKLTARNPALEMNGDLAAQPDVPPELMDTGVDCDDFE